MSFVTGITKVWEPPARTSLQKHTFDSSLYNIACAKVLAPGETITSVVSVLDNETALTYGAPVINTVAITLPNGDSAPIGTVIQVNISGGTIPLNSDVLGLGVPNLVCNVIAEFVTSLGQSLAVTELLVLQDLVPV